MLHLHEHMLNILFQMIAQFVKIKMNEKKKQKNEQTKKYVKMFHFSDFPDPNGTTLSSLFDF